MFQMRLLRNAVLTMITARVQQKLPFPVPINVPAKNRLNGRETDEARRDDEGDGPTNFPTKLRPVYGEDMRADVGQGGFCLSSTRRGLSTTGGTPTLLELARAFTYTYITRSYTYVYVYVRVYHYYFSRARRVILHSPLAPLAPSAAPARQIFISFMHPIVESASVTLTPINSLRLPLPPPRASSRIPFRAECDGSGGSGVSFLLNRW